MEWYEAFLNAKRGLYNTIHRTQIKNTKINDEGSATLEIKDPYNFEKWKLWPKRDNILGYGKNIVRLPYAIINNRANEQQKAKQLEQLLLSMPITYTKEEVEKFKRKYLQ